MRILMLGNSFTTANDLPGQLAAPYPGRRWPAIPGAGHGLRNI